MTSPRAHPYGETLMSFAAATLDPAFALVLNCHLHFCPACRRRVRVLEDVGGLLLEGVRAENDEALSLRTMSRFSAEIAQALSSTDRGARADPGDEAAMPAPLARIAGSARARISWQDFSPGAKSFELAQFSRSSARARIVMIEPGALLHSEKHGGQLALLLWGAYRYDGGRFERGDLHDIAAASGFKTFVSDSPEGAIFLTAIAPAAQFQIVRTAH
jgi:putative transcriptional regulator